MSLSKMVSFTCSKVQTIKLVVDLALFIFNPSSSVPTQCSTLSTLPLPNLQSFSGSVSGGILSSNSGHCSDSPSSTLSFIFFFQLSYFFCCFGKLGYECV